MITNNWWYGSVVPVFLTFLFSKGKKIMSVHGGRFVIGRMSAS